MSDRLARAVCPTRCKLGDMVVIKSERACPGGAKFTLSVKVSPIVMEGLSNHGGAGPATVDSAPVSLAAAGAGAVNTDGIVVLLWLV